MRSPLATAFQVRNSADRKVAGVASGIQGGQTDHSMTRLIGNAAEHPDGGWPANHHIRSVPAGGSRDIPPQRQAVFHHTVLVIQKLHRLHAGLGRAQSLFFLPQRAGLVGEPAVNTSFSPVAIR